MVANETPNKSCKDCARGSHVPTSSSNCHQASLTEVSREFRTLFKHLHSFKVPHFGMFVKLNGILINKFGKGVKSSGKWKRERSGTEASFPMIGCSAGGHHIGGQNCSNHFVDVPVLFLFFFVFFIFLSYSGSFACFFFVCLFNFPFSLPSFSSFSLFSCSSLFFFLFFFFFFFFHCFLPYLRPLHLCFWLLHVLMDAGVVVVVVVVVGCGLLIVVRSM